MATPLKLWQHSEPKRLWLALGGLSVLAHIGVLGLSLPYVLELMQSSDAAKTETIPIELIVVSPEDLFEAIDEPAQNINEPVQNIPSPAKEPYSPPPASDLTASVNNSTFSQDAVEESVAVPLPSLPEDRKEYLQAPDPDNSRDSDGFLNDSQSSPTEREDEESNNSEERESQADRELEPADSEQVDNTPTVPTLSGEPTLPVPGEQVEGQASRQPASRRAALSIVDFGPLSEEIRRDGGKTPIRPKEGVMATAITLDPIEEGCGQLEFSQQQWTYQVTVSAVGRIDDATIATGGISRETSEEEDAIACLIKSAGFQFEPATMEGEPTPDNLLITINVIEMPRLDL